MKEVGGADWCVCRGVGGVNRPSVVPSIQVIEPALRAVVNNFVSERNASEVMAVG